MPPTAPELPLNLAVRLALPCLLAALVPAAAHAAPPSRPAHVAASASNALPPPVLQALAQAGIAPAKLGYAVLAADSGAPLLSHRAEQPMQPASTFKLLTTYAALDLLGPQYTWKTLALADAAPVDGRLNGPLYLQGSGDPSLTLERFWLLLRQLRQRGIQHIAGGIVLDRSAYALPAYDPAAFDHEPLRPYNAGADALLVNFGAIRIDLLPDPLQRRVAASLATPSERLRIDNKLSLVEGPCGDWREKLQVAVHGERIELAGPYAAACGDKPLHLSLNDSAAASDAQVGDLLRSLWREMGGSIDGAIRSGSTPAGAKPLARWESPPLAEILRDTNKFSNNVMARQIFLALADASPATPDAAKLRMQRWLQGKGLNFAELEMDNGAGLSRSEKIAPGHLAQLLVDAWQNPLMPEFLATLPLAGIDGTLVRRFAHSSAQGRGHLKTGSLEGVRALAGYVQDQRGKRYALACFVNDPKAVVGVCDALADWVAGRK